MPFMEQEYILDIYLLGTYFHVNGMRKRNYCKNKTNSFLTREKLQQKRAFELN